jgi:hypothetical protein
MLIITLIALRIGVFWEYQNAQRAAGFRSMRYDRNVLKSRKTRKGVSGGLGSHSIGKDLPSEGYSMDLSFWAFPGELSY